VIKIPVGYSFERCSSKKGRVLREISPFAEDAIPTLQHLVLGFVLHPLTFFFLRSRNHKNYGQVWGILFGTVVKKTTFALMTLTILLIATVIVLSAPTYDPTWIIQTVDNNVYGYGNGYSPIVVDSNNDPHIAYTNVRIEANRFQTPLAMYASWNGTGWDSEQIAIGSAFSLLLDGNNNPHILYGGYSGHEGLIYASWTGKEWMNQTIDGTFWNGYGSFAFDSSGNPHVAYTSRYRENGTYRLIYASWADSDWSIQTLDKSEDIPFRTTLEIGKNNVIYLMYGYTARHYDSSGSYWESQSVKLATKENDGNAIWKIETVSSDITNYSNMVLDTQNFPHFAFQVKARGNPWTSDISYASWDGSVWSTQTIVSNVSLKVDYVNVILGGLALDSYGYPHLDYVTSEPNSDLCSVMYASWTGMEWSTQRVDSTHIAKGPCCLSIDSDGNPHISYLITPSGIDINSYVASILYATATISASQNDLRMLPLLVVIAVVVIVVISLLFFRTHRKTRC
jgi:hypothetical protein